VREIFCFDAGAVVRDRYPAVGDGDAHRGVGGTPFERVVDQVADGMVDRGGIDVYQAGVHLGVDGRLWHVLPQAAYRVVGEQVEAHSFAVRRGLVIAREVEQIGDQLVQLAGLLPSRPDERGGLRVGQPGAVLEGVCGHDSEQAGRLWSGFL
jgi:hypothetical protein